MKQHPRHPGQEVQPGASRREFLKTAALATASATVARLAGGSAAQASPRDGRGNTMPGRIVQYHDTAMEGHLPTINRDRVELAVHHGVRILTQQGNTAAAFETLLPGLHAASTIAIKVNCIGPTDTRWEVVRGIVSGLSLTLGGTYDISQVVIFDQHSLPGHGYSCTELTFNGRCPQIRSAANCGSYLVYGSYRLSGYLVGSDYVFNVPALKSHDNAQNQVTLAMKNHYGSCCPQNLCGNITGMLTVNADANIREKTALVLMDGLRGTYTGGPGGAPQSWSTFPESSPNTLFFSTDPVTNDYWGRDLINAERIARGMSVKPCPWIEQASGDPYNLGTSDPAQMEHLYYDPTAVADEDPRPLAAFLAPSVPNPFMEGTTVRFRLARGGQAHVTITDAAGRVVRRLAAGEFPSGYSALEWDARDERGGRVAAGTYFAHLEAEGRHQRRALICLR